MNTALIFVCSDNVDSYINAIAYLCDKCGVARFTFVFLRETASESPATNFVDNILGKLVKLAEGEYDGRRSDIDDNAKAQYALLAASLRASPPLREVTTLAELPSLLLRHAAAAKPDQLFIDTTGLTKSLMAHVFSIAIFLGYEAYTFELRERPNRERPELSLYFSLRPADFNYHPLTREITVQRIRSRLIPLPRILKVAAAISATSAVCFGVLLLVDPNNIVLLLIGLIANVIGVASGALQVLAMKREPS